MKKYAPIIVGLVMLTAIFIAVLAMGNVFSGGNSNTGNSLSPSMTLDNPRRSPLIVTLTFMTLPSGEGSLKYPTLSGGAEDKKMNLSIKSEAAIFADSETKAQTVNCEIYYNDNGLFSFALYSYDSIGNKIGVLALTYNCDTGTKLLLSDIMANQNPSWHAGIANILNYKARELVLLSEIKPLDDSRLFYITGTSIVFVYRLYEIATYSAGCIEIHIDYNELAAFLGPESPILRIKNLILRME
ncbi:MAG: RsiV family protein [Clostridia bacterium]